MARRRVRKADGTAAAVDLHPLVRLWMLRILVPLGGHRELLSQIGFRNDAVAAAVGLEHRIDPPDWSFDRAVVLRELRQLHRQAEARTAGLRLPEPLGGNVEELSRMLGLEEADGRILGFIVLLHTERLLDDAADQLGGLSVSKACSSIATILNLPEAAVRAALGSRGPLIQSGLVSVDGSGSFPLRSKLDLISGEFAAQMTVPDVDPARLLRGIVSPGAPGALALEDFSHVQRSIDVLLPHLRQSLASRRSGVNVFVYGTAGTGKSELARTLADALGCALYEVSSEDDEGNPVHGERRLRALRAAQGFFSQRPVLLAFDEAEDVFNDDFGPFGRRSTAQTHKAWINRMLESNIAPTLWLSNTIRGLDPAFVRRFDLVFELPVPPKKQRVRILREHCADLVDEGRLACIAEARELAPAVVSRAGSVVRSIRDELGPEKTADALEHLITCTLEAQGHRAILRHDPNRLPETYDPRFLHADADLEALADGLARARSGRLCLYGPPGTGKTACRRWIAERLDAPLLVQRASDLISMWVGETEVNIARAFREAQTEGAVLLIDEVDSFLQDRRRARSTWEVTAVNEMLTQMESFPGVFIASTNLVEGLDPAALRRFDLKARFDFLRADQAWDLLARQCAQLGLEAPPRGLRARVDRLSRLTPGDFATVVRQHRFRPISDAVDFVSRLEAECAMKEGAKRAIGFV